MNKYHRQEILAGFGKNGQQKLRQSSVLIIGAGGLGCPVLQYLVAMGVGRIGIIDGDIVSESNLHRQVLFSPMDINRKKVDVAYEVLSKLNEEVIFEIFPQYLDQKTCLQIFPNYDIIVDCSDNFPTRYMVNDACVLTGKPLAFAAVSQYEGQVALFNVSSQTEVSSNYRDLYPEPPKANEVMNCAEVGILGVTAGLIGLMQASEVVKYLSHTGQLLINKMLYYNMLDNSSFIVEYKPNSASKEFIPNSKIEFINNSYEQECEDIDVLELAAFELDSSTLKQFTVVDIRNDFELPKWTLTDYIAIELKDLTYRLNDLPEGKILFVCQAGVRSIEAARQAALYHNDLSRFYSLKGGMLKLNEVQTIL